MINNISIEFIKNIISCLISLVFAGIFYWKSHNNTAYQPGNDPSSERKFLRNMLYHSLITILFNILPIFAHIISQASFLSKECIEIFQTLLIGVSNLNGLVNSVLYLSQKEIAYSPRTYKMLIEIEM